MWPVRCTSEIAVISEFVNSQMWLYVGRNPARYSSAMLDCSEPKCLSPVVLGKRKTTARFDCRRSNDFLSTPFRRCQRL